MNDLKPLLLQAINASILGGHAIMKIYDSDFCIEHKKDDSPLTLADKNCHEVIEKKLKGTGIPILSEEGANIPFSIRKKWKQFWMVDPLDGTKEFIKRNGEFTVNIALIHKGMPILGVIYVPVKKSLYFALDKLGSYKVHLDYIIEDLNNIIQNSNKLPKKQYRKKFVVVGSRSHMTKETELFFEEKKKEHGDIEILSVGSSLKICMVAEGKADAYPRYAPTMEWDTAAGHAIAKYAGFSVQQYKLDKDVVYNKQNLLNPWFLVS